jgi:hypothetical protein
MLRGDGGGGERPRMTRFAGPNEPRLVRGSEPAFWAQETRDAVLIGGVRCPVRSLRGAIPCCRAGSVVHATPETRVEGTLDPEVDYAAMCPGSPSSVRVTTVDPMVDEAALCTSRQCVKNCDSDARHSIDICPRRARSSCAPRHGIMGSALEADGDLLNTCILRGPSWSADGPDLLFGGTCDIRPTA